MPKDHCRSSVPRPIYRGIHVLRDLPHYRFPIPALVSILHRASGLILIAGLALLLWVLQSSLSSEQGFLAIKAKFASPLVKAIFFVVLWAFLHHLCAGVRYLFLDMHRGVDLKSARQSSAVVLVVGLLATLTFVVRLW